MVSGGGGVVEWVEGSEGTNSSYKLWGCESCMVTIIYKRNPSGDTTELLGGAGILRRARGSPLTQGSCKLDASLRRLSGSLQHGHGYPPPQTSASDPPPPTPPMLSTNSQSISLLNISVEQKIRLSEPETRHFLPDLCLSKK